MSKAADRALLSIAETGQMQRQPDCGVIPQNIVERFCQGDDPPYTMLLGPWQMQAYLEFIERGTTHRTERMMKLVKALETELHERFSRGRTR